MKLKVSIDTSKLNKSIKEKMNQIIKNEKFLNEVGQEIVNDIKMNARLGKTIKDGKIGQMAPLKPVSVKQRRYLREAGNATARPYADQMSNLSMSGQLIDSVQYEIKGSTIEIQPKGQRKPYLTKKGALSKAEPIDNAELYFIHHSGDMSMNLPARPFVGLREFMKNRIFTKIKEYIRRRF